MYAESTAGTYGRVYKAVLLPPPKAAKNAGLPPALSVPKDQLSPTAPHFPGANPLSNPELCMRPGDLSAKEGDVFAIKKFKPDKEGDVQMYAGISQSGAREITASIHVWDMGNVTDLRSQLNRELHHRNLVALREVILEDKAIYMVFEYAEHDFLVSHVDQAHPSSCQDLNSHTDPANHPPSLPNHSLRNPIHHPPSSTAPTSRRRPLSSLQLCPSSRSQTRQYPCDFFWCGQNRRFGSGSIMA